MEYCGNLPHGNSKSERRHHRLMEYEYNFAWFITFDPDCTKNRNIKTSVGIFYRKQIVFEWFLFRVFSLTRQIVVKNSYELHQFSIFSIYGEWSQYYKIHAQQANDTKIRLTWLSWEISSTWRDKNREFHGNSKAPSISFDAFHALARLIVVVVDVVVVFFLIQAETGREKFPHTHWTWCEQMILVTFEIEFLCSRMHIKMKETNTNTLKHIFSPNTIPKCTWVSDSFNMHCSMHACVYVCVCAFMMCHTHKTTQTTTAYWIRCALCMLCFESLDISSIRKTLSVSMPQWDEYEKIAVNKATLNEKCLYTKHWKYVFACISGLD